MTFFYCWVQDFDINWIIGSEIELYSVLNLARTTSFFWKIGKMEQSPTGSHNILSGNTRRACEHKGDAVGKRYNLPEMLGVGIWALTRKQNQTLCANPTWSIVFSEIHWGTDKSISRICWNRFIIIPDIPRWKIWRHRSKWLLPGGVYWPETWKRGKHNGTSTHHKCPRWR